MRRVAMIIVALLVLLFVLENLDSVKISLVVGRPLELPLSLIVIVAFSGGFFVGVALLLKRRSSQVSLKEE